MKRITLATLVLLALAACGGEKAGTPASAQRPAETAHSGVSDKADDGWLAEAQEISRTIVGMQDDAAKELVVKSGGLPPAARYSYQVDVKDGSYYTFFADCDYDCSNIDLEVKDAAGNTLEKDFESDDSPMFGIRAKSAGQLTVDVVMTDCDTKECRFSSQVFEGSQDVF